ncbi:transposable element Tcb1 transposase [Trichonephila clavipes]|nr:transposable element Tcb1 transposase [Trichonephila clavipes]
MIEAGWSARRVARQLGRTGCVVKRCWDQWIREMSFTQRPSSGHPRQTSRREDRHIVKNARVQTTASSAAIQEQRHTAPTASVMVWGCTAYDTRSPLVLIRGTMTVHDILLMQRLPGAIFQQDNVLTRRECHKIVSELLLPFLGLPDPQSCLQSNLSGIIWDGKLGIPRV